jgi:hypothetical protein
MTMTYCQDGAMSIVGMDGVQILLSLMDTHVTNKEMLSSSQVALTNLCATEQARAIIRDIDGVRTVLRLLETHQDIQVFVQECLNTLVCMASDNSLSVQVCVCLCVCERVSTCV